MLHLRLHNARNFKKNAPTGSQKRAAATPFMTKTVAAANSKTQLRGLAPEGSLRLTNGTKNEQKPHPS